MEVTIITGAGVADDGPDGPEAGRSPRRDLCVVTAGEATLRDVLERAGVGDVDVALVDGRPVATGQPFADACRPGSVIDVTAEMDTGAEGDIGLAGADRRADASRAQAVRVVGGPNAGATHNIGTRSAIIVGRSAQADVAIDDPTVSPLHLRLRRVGDQWFAEDLDSHNGTGVASMPVRADEPVGGRVLQIGATSIEVGPTCTEVAHVRRPGADALTPFNRPPRPTPAEVDGWIEVPDPPAERRRGAAFSLVALVGPVLIGIVMVQVLGSMRYALFALLAPVMMITNALATRRRNAKDAKSSARRFRSELSAFEQTLEAAAADERVRRHRALNDLATLRHRAEMGSVRLWERRGHHLDRLALRLGTGPAPWSPPVDAQRVAAHPALQRVLDEHRVIEASALELSLAGGGVVGLVGERAVVLAVARSLVVQATALHGPSDLALAVVTTDGRAPAWDWVKWLPHTRAGTGRLLAHGIARATVLLDALADALDPQPAPWMREVDEIARPPLMLVVDGDELTTARRAPARAFLRGDHGPVAGVVVATSAERLPSSCTTVVHLDGSLGAATVHDVGCDRTIADVVVDGISAGHAESTARSMAAFSDPDLCAVGGDVPLRCGLLEVLDIHRDDGGAVSSDDLAGSWLRCTAADALDVPLGLGPDGPVMVDLVADGPHALVGGTTGAGKSEFLRSLVAGLAARHRPEDLVFVLIDYKGGSAFDSCARLPHTVGLVTDLDGHLAERALRSLEAELHHRERVLREAGASDLAEYRRGRHRSDPLPRLVVVVDEFATLAAERPQFMSSLVGIAQRGRSLGIHMVLATQRPAGAVNADIKANTNIRVALRMQDGRDSVDVIDTADAAAIDRRTPGRALVRLGPGELLAVQTPLSTAVSGADGPAVRLTPFRFGEPQVVEPDGGHPWVTDLDALVEATCGAHDRTGARPPRRPWLEMVGPVALDRLIAHPCGAVVPVAMADDPDHQRHAVASWDPAEGHLALLGAVGSGTSTALCTTALAALAALDRAVHLYGVDYGGGLIDLDPIDACGAIIGGHDRERQRRLVALLRSEVARRRAMPHEAGEWPLILLAIDDLPAWLADHADASGQDLADDVRRLFADGPSVGLVVAFTADRAAAVPMRFWGAVSRRFLFRHADPDELSSTGLRRHEVPEFVPGMAIDASSRLVVRFPTPPTGAWVAATACPAANPPLRIEALPDAIAIDELGGGVIVDDACWLVPVGIDAAHHAAARLPLRPGDGVLVAGPAHSGVSTALETIARQVRGALPAAVLVAVADDRSPLGRTEGLFDAVGARCELEKVLEVAAADDERSWLIVVDDAHLHDEPGALEPLLRPGSRCRIVVGGRADHLHGSFGHWTRAVRRASTGLLLNPRLDTDGDLLGVRLPRHLPVPLHAGRGFLVADADAVIVQFAA